MKLVNLMPFPVVLTTSDGDRRYQSRYFPEELLAGVTKVYWG